MLNFDTMFKKNKKKNMLHKKHFILFSKLYFVPSLWKVAFSYTVSKHRAVCLLLPSQ